MKNIMKNIMRKVYVVCVTLVMVLALAGCCDAKYYCNEAYANPVEEMQEEAEVETVLLEGEELELCQKVYTDVSEYFSINKEPPTFCVMQEEKNSANMQVDGYSFKNNIYVRPGAVLTESGKALIAHEVCHYLGNLTYEEQNYSFGKSFNEGVTNYLSTQVYSFPEEECIYEYETHVAKMFASAIGEEELRKCYFNSDVETLRSDFNETMKDIYPRHERMQDSNIKVTAFDIFVGNLDWYSINLAIIAPGPSFIATKEMIGKLVNSCEEEMLKYNEQKGVDARELTRQLVSNEKKIAWSMISKFNEML